MSHAAREWAWRQDLKPIPKFVLTVLGDAANDACVCWPRIAIIAAKVGVSTRTVQRAIQLLVSRGLITVEQRYRNDGSHSSNLYRLHLDRGVSVSPPPDGSDTTPGHPCQGPPDTSVIPGTVRRTKIEPPQPHEAESGCPGCGGEDFDELHFPRDLMPEERTQARSMIAGLDAALAQPVLDEWAGIITAGDIRTSTLGCLRALIARAQAGTFTPERALRVAQTRETRQRVEVAQAAIERPELPPPDENNLLVRRVQDMARRIAEKKRVTS